MAAKKQTGKKSPVSAIIDRFDGTIIEQPIAIANKAVLAGLGFATQFQSGFEVKVDELAKDGEKVRSQVEESIGRIAGQIETTRGELTKRAESAVNAVLRFSPIATAEDVRKLNVKLDKVLVQVAS